MTLRPDLVALIASGVSAVLGTCVLLVLYQRFRTVVAANWAAVLAAIGGNDFLQVAVAALHSSNESRYLGPGQVVIGHLVAATLFVAVTDPASPTMRWRRYIYACAPLMGVLVVGLLLWTEPASVHETPGNWYRAAANPGLLAYFGLILVSIAVRAWLTFGRLRTIGRLFVAVGVTLAVLRPYFLSLAYARGSGDLFAVSALTLAVAATIVILHYGIVIDVMDAKLALDVEQARRAELAVRNEQLGLMAEGLAGEVAQHFRSALASARSLRGATPSVAPQRPEYHQLESSLQHGIALAEDLRAFAAGDRAAGEVTDLGDHVRTHASMLQWVLGEPHRLTTDVEPRPLPVHVTAVRVTHILTDLLQHCRSRGRDGQVLHVSVRGYARDVTHDLQVGDSTVRPGHWVVLVVAVDGRGVTASEVEHLFDAVRVAQPARTGGALAVVSALLHDAGGAVQASNVYGGQGEVVECWFPRAQAGSAD